MKASAVVFSLVALAGCAHGSGDGASGAGRAADAERALTLEAPAPRRHLGNLARGGVYDN